MRVLFMCVANSARSQMAEGLAKFILGSNCEIMSAGSKPTKVNPFAIQALNELGIDITQNHSKSLDDLPKSFLSSVDFLITLCSEEVCPNVPIACQKLHWPIFDPASVEGGDSDKLAKFIEIRDLLKYKIENFKYILRQKNETH